MNGRDSELGTAGSTREGGYMAHTRAMSSSSVTGRGGMAWLVVVAVEPLSSFGTLDVFVRLLLIRRRFDSVRQADDATTQTLH